MSSKWCFTIQKAWQWRKALKQALSNAHAIPTLTALTAESLHNRHVRCLVLDFDGVMASQHETEVHPDVAAWLMNLAKEWPLTQVAVLSNKPFSVRIQALAQKFPDIQFIQGVAPKPFPMGLQEVARQRGLATDELLLVDDRLCTGMLAVTLAGAQGMLVLYPYQDFRKRPVTEGFFATLRWVERALVRTLA
ncbi:MAG: HAD family hydrolase [Pseudomonadota bacterium]